MRHDEKQKELEIKNFGSKKMGFQHWWLINQVHAKEFTNLGGPPVFLTTKKNGAVVVD
jgi:hypothetical protein